MKVNQLFPNSFVEEYLKENKITQFTSIQEKVIPEILKGKSVNVIAKTGSGKTLAFLLPTVELVKNYELNHGMRMDKSDMGKPLAIILAPTRELCQQLLKVSKGVSHHAKLRVRSMLGGTGTKTKEIKYSHVDILIATPGRLASGIKRKEVDLSDTRYFIMDEADQLLELGFKKDLMSIYEACDKSLLKIELFSATMSESLTEFVNGVFSDVDFYEYNIQDKNQLVRSVRTFNIYLKDDEKNKMTLAFLKNEAKGRGIIFVNKHQAVDDLIAVLKKEMPKVEFFGLHGEMEALDRKKTYDKFIKSKGILVATDVMARGIDIPDLNWVLNYDLPFEAVYYIHRCGRVGRNMKDGFAYNLVTPRDSAIVARINEAIKNQTALILTTLDEKKFKANKTKTEIAKRESKLDKKKQVLKDLQSKIARKKTGTRNAEKVFKKHVKLVKADNTPRYKKNAKKKK